MTTKNLASTTALTTVAKTMLASVHIGVAQDAIASIAESFKMRALYLNRIPYPKVKRFFDEGPRGFEDKQCLGRVDLIKLLRTIYGIELREAKQLLDASLQHMENQKEALPDGDPKDPNINEQRLFEIYKDLVMFDDSVKGRDSLNACKRTAREILKAYNDTP